ncbi:MAG: cyanophycinase-like exopeptidase [Bacteroidia bacterium]|jgi:cyanophycinase-like exopeptidase
MGGASEHDEAMKWFLQQANGGDILVLRASGSDGYNDYLYSDLGVTVNSVETIVFNNSNASNSAYVQDKVAKAEAIWMAGGNQWNYVSYWRNTPIDSLINIGLTERNIVIGGTSAGMAVQGGLYFSAENGTVTSAAALANPYNIDMTVDSTDFLHNDYLQDVITDTHYDDPDRKGRHVAFLARAVVDYGVSAKGIACDEYTAVCIDQAGLATVYGEYPEYDETIYFLQVNCEVADNVPETCVSGSSLTWNHAGQAVKVYVVKGTEFGANTFSLADWETGSGGVWENWSVNNGVLSEVAGDPINCSSLGIKDQSDSQISLTQNAQQLRIELNTQKQIRLVQMMDATGRVVVSDVTSSSTSLIDLNGIPKGIYVILIETGTQRFSKKWMRQ